MKTTDSLEERIREFSARDLDAHMETQFDHPKTVIRQFRWVAIQPHNEEKACLIHREIYGQSGY